jgi:ribosomal protein S26
MEEAVTANNALLYQSYQKDKSIPFDEPNPFVELEEQVAVRVGYVYKVFTLPKRRKICIRCSIHTATQKEA